MSSETLTLVVDAWWAWLAPASVRLAALTVGVWAVDRVVGRRTWPRVRATVWITLALAFAAPPGLHARWGLLPAALPAPGAPTAALEPTPSEPATGASIGAFEPAPSEPATGASIGASRPGAGLALAFAAWSSGVVAVLLVGRRRARLARRRFERRPDVTDPRTLATARHLAARLGLRTMPRLVIAPDGHGPAVLGIRRPLVALPATLLARPRALEHTLRHEFTHVRRRDPAAAAAWRVLAAVYWFHPAAWLVGARLAELRELCCDAAVADRLRERTPEYRRVLLEGARHLGPESDSRVAPATLALFGGASRLLTRLAWLEQPGGRHRGAQRVACVAAAVATLALVVPHASAEVPLAAGLTPPSPTSLDARGCLTQRFAVLRALAEARSDALTDDAAPR